MSTNLENKLNTILNEKREKILPQNIKKGVTVFDITGELEILDTSDATAVSRDIVQEKTAYVNGKKIQGTMPNNGLLSYEPTEEEQNIPTGYTSGGTIEAVDITKLNEYQACLTLANSIETTEIYTDTTATADDIKEGKIAYSNGERIIGTAKISDFAITDASFLFYLNSRLDSLKELLNLCKNVTSMYNMFNNCTGLTSLDLSNFDTSNVTRMESVFSSCNKLISLNVSNFDTRNVTTMGSMFSACSQLTSLDVSSFDTSNVKYMANMFYGCSSLTTLDVSNFNTENVTNLQNMFNNCTGLISLDLSNFIFEKVIYVNNIFASCTNLTNLKSFKNLGKGYTSKLNNNNSYKLDLSSSTLLTHESLMSVINNLYDLNLTYDVANGGTLYTQSLVLGTTNLAKLTAEEIAIGTAKRLVNFIERRKYDRIKRKNK